MIYTYIKRSLIATVMVLVLLGCYTFHATTKADSWSLETIDTIPGNIILIIDDEYRTYESHDRGHALADPQTYYLGPALEKLTESYFRQSFTNVTVVKNSTSIPNTFNSGFILHPSVTKFKNKLTTSNQTLELSLSVSVRSASGMVLGEVQGLAYTSHRISPFGPDMKKTELALGRLIQDVLLQVTKKVKERIHLKAQHTKHYKK